MTNVEDILEEHRRDTHCTFGTRSSKKGSLTTSSCQQAESETPSSALSSTQQDEKENVNPKKVHDYKLLCESIATLISTLIQATKSKIFWQHTIENEHTEFNYTPFTVSETRRLDCQFGKQYFKEKPAKSNRTRLQGTRKIGCAAHITVKTLTLFPEYAIEDPSSIGPRKLKEKNWSNYVILLKLKLEKKNYIVLPTKEAHHSVHPTEGAIGYAQRMHPKLAEKIQDLVSEGITNVPEGLVLQPNAHRAAKRRAQQVCKTYKTLPFKTRRGKVCTDWKVRNRVGAKVDRLKKVKKNYRKSSN